ncbi:MAG: hypothetical protein O3C60_08025 [Planctomycetota bacterium]|nr:hypothetical protein [Planctomycetota bacterium]
MLNNVLRPLVRINSGLISILLTWQAAHGTPLVYEGFRLPLADGASLVGQGGGYGFAPQSTWDLSETPDNRAPGTVRFRAEGLSYSDSMGRPLLTEPGAVELQAADLENIFSRPLAEPITVRPGEYWVSYLMKWNGNASGLPPFQPGSLFWTPDGEWDRGAVGLPPSNLPTATLGFINGQASPVSVQPLETHWIVVRISRGELGLPANAVLDRAQLWIDPPLQTPGMPHAEYQGTKLLDSRRQRVAHQIQSHWPGSLYAGRIPHGAILWRCCAHRVFAAVRPES